MIVAALVTALGLVVVGSVTVRTESAGTDGPV
jgi:hypothetical protein